MRHIVFVVRYKNRKGRWVFPGWDFLDKSQAIAFLERKREEHGGEWGICKAEWKKGKETLTTIAI